MRRIVIAMLALIALSAAASAGWTCNQVGDYTYCHDYATGQSYTCNRVGNYTYCN